jgi:hypothetical protein
MKNRYLSVFSSNGEQARFGNSAQKEKHTLISDTNNKTYASRTVGSPAHHGPNYGMLEP